jgi:hypothetical protein
LKFPPIRGQAHPKSPEKRGFPSAIAADKANSATLGESSARLVEQNARAKPQSDVIEMEHRICCLPYAKEIWRTK